MIINENGIQLDDFDVIFNNLVESFKSVYGQDINLAQDTTDGQQVGIYSNIILDLQSLIAEIYNGFDPDLATRGRLIMLLKLIGIEPKPATKSTVDILITANKDVFVPENYKIQDESGQEWTISTPQAILRGSTLVSFEAVLFGKISALANKINKPVSILTEIVSVNNPLPAVDGEDEESDIEIRRRRRTLVNLSSYSTIGGLLGKILNINEVQDVIIYENKTDVYDVIRDIPSHSLWIIVEGGSIDKITEIIAKDKTAGTGLKGAISQTYTEAFKRYDGTLRNFYHEIKFDRPAEKNLYIRLNVMKRQMSDLIDTDLIENSLKALVFNINQTITATELYATVYATNNNFIASDLEISFDGLAWVSDKLITGFMDRPVVFDVTITEI